MGKLSLGLGLGVGYVLGTQAGRKRYEQIKQAAAGLMQRPEVQQALDKAQASAPAPLRSGIEKLTSAASGGSSADAGMVGRGPNSWSASNAVFAETTAAVPSYAELDRETAALRMVSVSVYEPLTMATPSTMARAVSTVRRRR